MLDHKQGTLLGISYGLSQLTKPARIMLFLVMTPVIAHFALKEERPKRD
jgi:hypothetical protein